MSTKVAKVSKTSQKIAPAKAVSKTALKAITTTDEIKKSEIVRLSEEDKKNSDDYIKNPKTNKYVSKTTSLGKLLVKALENGEELPESLTDTEMLILVVQNIKDFNKLDDSSIKNSLKNIDKLPRGFPVAWGGKQKIVRSVDHPKQPSNPFIYFTKATRQSVVNSNPGISNTEIISIVAKLWKDTPEEKREEYIKQAKDDKQRYQEEMKLFESKHPEQARSKSGQNKPTKATAYHKFCEENREILRKENSEIEGKDITKLLTEKWEIVKKDKDELSRYQLLANKANEDFEKRITEYHENDSSSKKLSKAEQEKKDDPEHFELNAKTGRYGRKESKKVNTVADNSEPEEEQPKEEPKEPEVKSKTKSKEKPKRKRVVNESTESTESTADDDLLA